MTIATVMSLGAMKKKLLGKKLFRSLMDIRE
jgi:hypothetical protein